MSGSAPPFVVIVSGPPASGKTTLGARLATALQLPFITRDAFKETLFDTLGWRDRAWSRQMGGASWALLFQTLELLLAGHVSCVVESNSIAARDTARFAQLQERHRFRVTRIVCVADDETLLRRHQARATDGTRHPGHVDHLNRDEFAAVLAERHNYTLGLSGPQITLDTTQPDDTDLEQLIATLRIALPG